MMTGNSRGARPSPSPSPSPPATSTASTLELSDSSGGSAPQLPRLWFGPQQQQQQQQQQQGRGVDGESWDDAEADRGSGSGTSAVSTNPAPSHSPYEAWRPNQDGNQIHQIQMQPEWAPPAGILQQHAENQVLADTGPANHVGPDAGRAILPSFSFSFPFSFSSPRRPSFPRPRNGRLNSARADKRQGVDVDVDVDVERDAGWGVGSILRLHGRERQSRQADGEPDGWLPSAEQEQSRSRRNPAVPAFAVEREWSYPPSPTAGRHRHDQHRLGPSPSLPPFPSPISRFGNNNNMSRLQQETTMEQEQEHEHEHEHENPPLDPPPDGGWLAWAHALSGALVIFNCWGLNLAFGVFEAYYKIRYIPHHSHSAIAWIGSVQLSLVFFTVLVVGRCYDLGYARHAFHLGSVGLVLCIFLTSLCTTWAQLFAVQGLLTGVCMGAVFCSGVLVVQDYFHRNLGLAISVGAAGSSVGGIVYTLMARSLLPAVGFANTVRYMGVVALVTMVPSNVIIRPRKTRAVVVRMREHGREHSGAEHGDGQGAGGDEVTWRVFRREQVEPSFVLMTCGMFFSFWGLYFGFYYIVLYGYNVLHLSSTAATNVLITMLSTNLPGRILPGLLSDRWLGPLNTLTPSCLFTAVVAFLWIGVDKPAGLYILACVYGFASAGLQSLFSPAIAAFAPPDDARRGVKTAVVFVAIGASCLTGTPLGGALIDAGAKRAPVGMEYVFGQVFAATAMAAGAVCFLASRVCRVGWRAVRA